MIYAEPSAWESLRKNQGYWFSCLLWSRERNQRREKKREETTREDKLGSKTGCVHPILSTRDFCGSLFPSGLHANHATSSSTTTITLNCTLTCNWQVSLCEELWSTLHWLIVLYRQDLVAIIQHIPSQVSKVSNQFSHFFTTVHYYYIVSRLSRKYNNSQDGSGRHELHQIHSLCLQLHLRREYTLMSFGVVSLTNDLHVLEQQLVGAGLIYGGVVIIQDESIIQTVREIIDTPTTVAIVSLTNFLLWSFQFSLLITRLFKQLEPFGYTFPKLFMFTSSCKEE